MCVFEGNESDTEKRGNNYRKRFFVFFSSFFFLVLTFAGPCPKDLLTIDFVNRLLSLCELDLSSPLSDQISDVAVACIPWLCKNFDSMDNPVCLSSLSLSSLFAYFFSFLSFSFSPPFFLSFFLSLSLSLSIYLFILMYV